MEEMKITSMQNPRVKAVVTLQQKSAERRRTGLFVVEGKRELEHCVRMGLEVKEVFVCREIAGEVEAQTNTLEVSKEVYEKMVGDEKLLDEKSIPSVPLSQKILQSQETQTIKTGIYYIW